MANTKPSDTFLGITSENDMVYLGEASGTGAASVDLEPAGMDNSLYDMYMMAGSMAVKTGGSSPEWQGGNGAGPTYMTSNYNGTGTSVNGGTPANPSYVSQAQMRFDGGQGAYADVDMFFQMWWEWNSTNTLLQFHQRCEYYKHTGAVYSITDIAGAVSGFSTEPTGLRLKASSGNIDVNHVRMYGIKKT